MAYEYRKKDLAGYPFNAKYPPNYEKNGGLYHGYKNNSEETFYYDFAVQRYDLRFSYNGKKYYFLSNGTMPLSVTNISQMRFEDSRMAMPSSRNSRLTERN